MTNPFAHYRWRICALLFFATTINYIDRQVIGILAPTLQREIGWDEVGYSQVVQAFQVAYAVGLALAGGLLDRVGVRWGLGVAIVAWSLAGMGHALARTVAGFAAARFALGLGEAANFPACVKAIGEWFPRSERALATGIFNSGSNVGAIVAPLVVPLIATQLGWQMAFVITGALGFIWLLFWWAMYQPPQRKTGLAPAELALIQSDGDAAPPTTSWWQVLPHRQTLALCLARFVTDPVWWFFLFWLPKFLYAKFGLLNQGLSLPLVVIFLVADVGSIAGGWLSSRLLAGGAGLDAARRTTLLICALAATPVALASQAPTAWGAVALVAVAAAAYQGWSANIFTLVSDLYPQNATASMAGLAGMAGALGGTLFSAVVGRVLQDTGSYDWLFAAAGTIFLAAWLLLKLLLPQLRPVQMGRWPEP
jgi:ACS family hexuronate transporter-like MFS transporter